VNITCNFLCCNHQVHRDFLITLCSTVVLMNGLLPSSFSHPDRRSVGVWCFGMATGAERRFISDALPFVKSKSVIPLTCD
jgi:hypothetical protein